MKSIETLLRDRIGLDTNVHGSGVIQRVVRRRMGALRLSNPGDYYDRLRAFHNEFLALVEAVVITETWFFREFEAFDTLARLAMGEWLLRHGAGTLRILSLPCSSGEEPFSIAMALLDSGFPPDRFQVDAMDISARALVQARHGVFAKHSFRGKELAFQDRHFRQVGSEFLLNSAVRRPVGFFQANLLDPSFVAPHSNYHFIFFRNLLVYLESEAQKKALDKIGRLLSPGGLLFVGPAEQPIAFNCGFVSAGHPLAFACAKTRDRRAHPVRSFPIQHRPEHPIAAQSVLERNPGATPPIDLKHARRLADAGRLVEAAAICEAHLRSSQSSAQAYYLLGLVRDARGDSSAAECYRRALYLEPNHYQALIQLAILARKKGDLAAARNLQRRAQRIQPDNQADL